MRWVALGVDYEMAGKDLIDRVKLSGEICRALGGEPPEGFNYELFLDEKGQKISKSKGNGLTIDEWLAYGTPGEPGAVHVPEAARGEAAVFRRHPARTSTTTSTSSSAIRSRTAKSALGNPVWHIHAGEPPPPEVVHERRRPAGARRSPSRMLLNLVAVANAEDPGGALGLHPPLRAGRLAETHPRLDAARRLCGRATSAIS